MVTICYKWRKWLGLKSVQTRYDRGAVVMDGWFPPFRRGRNICLQMIGAG